MNIGIVVVHYGDTKELTCVPALEKADVHIDYTHKFVTDSVGYYFKNRYLALVKDNNIENDGFTRGNNVAIKQFLELNEKPDWIWLLNNDTDIPPATFNSIPLILGGLPKDVGIVGFQIRSMSQPDLIHHAGTGRCFPAGEHKSGSVKLHQFTTRTSERWVTFASVLIRREVFETIGLLDERMWHICSDSDFCYRARAAGWKIIYEPNFMVYHKIGTSQNPNPVIMKQMQADTIEFQNKWLNGKLFMDLDMEVMT